MSKAHTRKADVVIVDLEDSIPLTQKQTARENINSALDALRENRQTAFVRVNGDLSNLVKDLEMLRLERLSAIVIPKVEYVGMVKVLDSFLSTLEAAQGLVSGSTKLVATIESAVGGLSATEISTSSGRLIALAIGSEDYAADIGCEPCEEALLGVCQNLIMAARQAGIVALGFPGSISEISDFEKLQSHVRKARAMGFSGAMCIHPSQVPIVNEGFAGDAALHDWADKVVLAMREAALAGKGTCQVDGQMVDAPVLARAERVIASRK